MAWPGAVRHEGGGEAGRHGGGVAGVGLPAGELVVTPDDTRLNRICDLEKPPRGGRGRSTPAYGKAGRKILREFPQGADPCRPRGLRAADRSLGVSPPRLLERRARREGLGVPAPWEMIAAGHGRDNVCSGPVAAPCLRQWPCRFDWPARVASVVRHLDKSGRSNEPGASAAETSIRSP